MGWVAAILVRLALVVGTGWWEVQSESPFTSHTSRPTRTMHRALDRATKPTCKPLLTPQQRTSSAEASHFTEHATPLSSPTAFASPAASIEYNKQHFSSPPSFPAFSHVLSALISPQVLAYRREQFIIRERVKEEKRFGSVRVGGRGRRSTRITPGIGAGAGGAGAGAG